NSGTVAPTTQRTRSRSQTVGERYVCLTSVVRRLAWLCMALGASALSPCALYAQDDWSITRERSRAAPRRSAPASIPRAPKDARARYLEVLRRNPDDGFALERLRAIALEEDGSLEPLRAMLHAE